MLNIGTKNIDTIYYIVVTNFHETFPLKKAKAKTSQKNHLFKSKPI